MERYMQYTGIMRPAEIHSGVDYASRAQVFHFSRSLSIVIYRALFTAGFPPVNGRPAGSTPNKVPYFKIYLRVAVISLQPAEEESVIISCDLTCIYALGELLRASARGNMLIHLFLNIYNR